MFECCVLDQIDIPFLNACVQEDLHGGGGVDFVILYNLSKVFAGMVTLLCLPTHTTGAAEHAQSCVVFYVGSGMLNEGP